MKIFKKKFETSKLFVAIIIAFTCLITTFSAHAIFLPEGETPANPNLKDGGEFLTSESNHSIVLAKAKYIIEVEKYIYKIMQLKVHGFTPGTLVGGAFLPPFDLR